VASASRTGIVSGDLLGKGAAASNRGGARPESGRPAAGLASAARSSQPPIRAAWSSTSSSFRDLGPQQLKGRGARRATTITGERGQAAASRRAGEAARRDGRPRRRADAPHRQLGRRSNPVRPADFITGEAGIGSRASSGPTRCPRTEQPVRINYQCSPITRIPPVPVTQHLAPSSVRAGRHADRKLDRRKRC